MKRHNAAELPVPASFGGVQDEKGKVEKVGGGGGRQGKGSCCSRLWFMVVLSATVTMLVRYYYYDSSVGQGVAGGVVRVDSVARHSYHRKVNSVDRGGGRPSFSGSFSSPPNDDSKKPLADSGGGGPLLSGHSPSPVDASTKKPEPLQDGGGNGSVAAAVDHKWLSDSSTSTTESDGDQPAAAHPFARALAAADNKGDRCGGRYIYVQDLPPRFNTDMVKNCAALFPWTDKCEFTANGGFGLQMSSAGGVFQETGWYNTDQYTMDIIFHERIKRYECLTVDPSLAAAVYVPFYAGLELERHLWGFNVTKRDAMALEAVDIITARPEWRFMGGRDHFFTAGRTTWDFRRLADGDSDWGSKLFLLPAIQNMTALVAESSPWHLNDAAIPFPTAFHPASDEAVFIWQDKIRRLERPWLFTFAGAPRPGITKSIRNELIAQCRASSVCSLMQCVDGPINKCGSPASYMKLFQSSTFCLQPQGDSYTRKSAFDCMLAGCIPVFFHPGTAYVQYTWHLPKNHADYSVYISEDDVRNNVSIEERLRQIPPATVERMRETVINLVPVVVYAQPSSKLETVKDAFDLAIDTIIGKVTKLRRAIVEGQAEEEKLEMYSWKYPLLREGQKVEDPHEWDPLFAFV
ncbi:hypothetical protein GUJ93_ZPchr0012g22201 [Zizania palustris]|uniref:Exostosin GT47 domain-containing protein n=1 Tax=Zizania palustris TaxID=103762 RepID=A0A8J5WLI4_ZIZPA|nr:hypothetical protein GUJ93_ZPchr0012g22201 [Zizania palustris]